MKEQFNERVQRHQFDRKATAVALRQYGFDVDFEDWDGLCDESVLERLVALVSETEIDANWLMESPETLVRMHQLIEQYFPEDVGFVVGQLFDAEDEIGFLYRQLLEIGEDPDEILIKFGVIERSE